MIEYLIRKGRVHELNMDALLVALLPFHETYFFKRVLILCRTGVDERWAFLDKARSLICQEFTELHKRHAPMHDYENGIQISREVLLKRFMESDTSILGLLEDFIRDYFKNEILLENISLTIHMSFWTSCLMELCHLHKAKKMTNKYF